MIMPWAMGSMSTVGSAATMVVLWCVHAKMPIKAIKPLCNQLLLCAALACWRLLLLLLLVCPPPRQTRAMVASVSEI
jgi:hypothetical protein